MTFHSFCCGCNGVVSFRSYLEGITLFVLPVMLNIHGVRVQDLADDDAAPDQGENIEIRQGEPEKPNAERVTTRYMTKYEKARILGTRALQIRCERYHQGRCLLRQNYIFPVLAIYMCSA